MGEGDGDVGEDGGGVGGRRVSPLVLGSHGAGGVRAPSRLHLSLCLSLFLRSQILPLHRFVYIWRSVTPIGLKPSP